MEVVHFVCIAILPSLYPHLPFTCCELSLLVFTCNSSYCYSASSYCNSVCLSVRSSVRSSHGWISQKQCKL